MKGAEPPGNSCSAETALCQFVLSAPAGQVAMNGMFIETMADAQHEVVRVAKPEQRQLLRTAQLVGDTWRYGSLPNVDESSMRCLCNYSQMPNHTTSELALRTV